MALLDRLSRAAWVVVPLDLEKLGAVGRTIQVRMEATFSGVTAPGKHYLGAKGMLIVTDAETGKVDYPPGLVNPGRNNWGDMPWRVTSGAAICPEKPGKSSFVMGLQNSYGRVSFRNVKFYCGSKEPGILSVHKPAAKLKYTMDWKPLRGVMSPVSRYDMKESEFALLDSWGANAIRWQVFPEHVSSPENLGEFLDREHERLAWVLDICRKYDIRVIVDLHPNNNGKQVLGDPEGRRKVMEFWTKTARRYKGHPALFAYDLLNEPLPYDVEPGGPSIHEQYKALLAAVRQVDPVTPVILPDADGKAVTLTFRIEENLKQKVHDVLFDGATVFSQWDLRHSIANQYSYLNWLPFLNDYLNRGMLNRRETLRRIELARQAGVPITNYGMAISACRGVLERALSPFPDALNAFQNGTGRELTK